MQTHRHRTISLIGMPGAGKSTIGVILAKITGLRFCDTDLDIQVREGSTLQEIIDRHGYLQLRAVEKIVLLDLDLDNAVVATGGSAVYCEEAMARLGEAGPIIYLEVALPILERRVAAAPLRGIASDSEQAFVDIFAERTPLYRNHANLVIDASRGCPEEIAAEILQRLPRRACGAL